MKINDFKITVNSLPDRENLVAEIYYKHYQVAEISQEEKEMKIQFYSHPKQKYWEFSLEEIQNIIEKAKNRLIEVG
jgi:hypothetical protein